MKLYELTATDPLHPVSIGGGRTTSAAQAFNDANQTEFHITDLDGVNIPPGHGAWTDVSQGLPKVYFNVLSSATGSYNAVPDNAGSNFQILHEIGHVLNHFEQMVGQENESYASAAAYSPADAMQLPIEIVDS